MACYVTQETFYGPPITMGESLAISHLLGRLYLPPVLTISQFLLKYSFAIYYLLHGVTLTLLLLTLSLVSCLLSKLESSAFLLLL